MTQTAAVLGGVLVAVVVLVVARLVRQKVSPKYKTAVAAAGMVVAAASGVATYIILLPPSRSLPITMTECPNHNFTDSLLLDPLGNTRAAFTSVKYGDIPEFHDCQKLVLANANDLEYGPTVGIFVTTDSTKDVQSPPSPSSPVVAIVAHLDGPDYSSLGIYKGVNCLFVFSSAAGLNASMVGPISRDETCRVAADGTPILAEADKPKAHVTPLWVMNNSIQPSGQDVPEVARWDFDSANKRNSIGVKCGDRWCEIGANSAMQTTVMISNPDGNPVRAVKGWYDQQRLAEPDSKGMTISEVTGTIVPVAGLDALGQDDFVKFLDVATATVDKAYSMGLEAGDNTVALCSGTLTTCAGPGAVLDQPCKPQPEWPVVGALSPATEWWARITAPSGRVTYRCVLRHHHGALAVPGTARWRWTADDEPMWVRCTLGCCQIY